MLEERRLFSGENSDDEDRILPQGDYRYGLNIEVDNVDGANVGVVTNAKGNRLVATTLPSGINEVIGQGVDDENSFTYYFVHNSNGDHCIYRFNHLTEVIDLVMQNRDFNFSVDYRVNSVDVVNGKLLYWTDGLNPPRKINVDKATEAGKKRKFNIYFGDAVQTGEAYTFGFILNGSLLFTWNYTASNVPNGSAYDLAYDIVANLPAGATALATFEACGASVEVEMILAGEYTMTAISNVANQVIVTAENFYPQPYAEDFIDRLKYPLDCEPTALYKEDTTKKQNLVQNQVFQFAIQYMYDDNEKSAISPYSMIPAPAEYCGVTTNNSNLNYIEVDFTNVRLNDPIRRSLIKAINIIYREHNTGELRLADTLQPHQFGIGRNIYKFYNNANYSVVPDNEANKLFDSMPITCGTSDVIANRVFDSDIVEGYDPTCIDADINVSYNSVEGGFDISGVVSIIQFENGNTAGAWNRQPVWSDFSNQAPSTWGWGMTKSAWQDPSSSGTDRPFIGSDPNVHKIPFGGFVVYLAGTDFYGITKQRTINEVATGLPVSIQNTTTGLVRWSNAAQWAIMSNISNSNAIYSSSFLQDWKISGVKPGVYSLRIASSFMDSNDLIDPSRRYQKTSTTIQTSSFASFNGGVCNTGETEAIIEVLASGVVNVRNPSTYAIVATSSTGDVGETFVRDYSPGDWAMYGTGGNLYLVDGGGDSAPTNPDVMLGYPTLSKVSSTATFQIAGNPNQTVTSIADHNGFASYWIYFYFPGSVTPIITAALTNIATRNPISSAALRIYELDDPIDIISVNTTLNWPSFVSNYSTGRSGGYYFHGTASLRTDDRTLVEGTVRDSFGNLTPNVNVALTNHNAVSTDSQGRFSISYYATNYPTGETDRLLVSSTGLCRLTALQPMTLLNFIVGPLFYTEANPYDTGNHIINYQTQGFSALKRGWDGAAGIVYYDRGNRSSAVNTNESLELHIPFYTEPVNGVQFLSHAPVVNWEIRNPPPDWATHYQWVRTQNYQMSFYLQFSANTVEYVNKPETPDPTDNPVVGFATGRYAAISTANLLTYKDQYAASLLGYTWEKGDRIRFIAKPGNIYYPSYFDFEILAADSPYIFINSDQYIGEILGGTLFEIYRPKQSSNQKIFYEIGECFEIGDNGHGKFHKGPTQDQDPSNPYTVPARGVFTTGDAWYRERLIPYNNAGAAVGEIHTIDSASLSDFYASEDDNIGRPNIYDPNLRQIRREKSIRFSDIYLNDTQINGLSSNAALNIETIEKGDGPVYRLIRAGNVLVAIQRNQCNSVYVNEIIYIDANANPSLTASTKVIGTIRPLIGQFGTINPESVVEYEGKVYFFDQSGGNVIRYSQDGLNPINYFKMRSYFGAKATEMASLPQVETYAIGGFDPLNKRYILTFKKNRDASVFTEDTKVFNEISNRWTSSMSYIGECYGMTGMSVISFKDGQLWVHDSPVKNNFYGVQYDSSIKTVFNLDSGKVRNFMALSLESDKVWSCPSINVPANANAPSGMLSRLLDTKFVKKEGVWYAALMKDMNSPNFATQTEALILGRDLRGHVLIVTFVNENTDEVRLTAVNLKYIYSEYSKK